MIQQPVGIFGAGSIGAYVGAHLIRASIPTILVGRQRLGQEIRQHGMRITSLAGTDFALEPQQVDYDTTAERLAKCAIVLVAVKSADTAAAASQIQPHLAPGTLVVSLQNGVRNAAVLRENLPMATVLAGMVPYNVVWGDNAHFHCGTSGELVIEQHAATEAVLAIFRQAGLAAKAHANMAGVLWSKLLFNLNNAINALAAIPLKAELEQAGYRAILAAAISEALAALKAAAIQPIGTGGVPPKLVPAILRLPDPLFQRVARRMLAIDPLARSSMWEDVQRGRPTEIDYLNGEVARLAEALGRAAPVNQRLVTLIKALEAGDSRLRGLSAAELAWRTGLLD